MRRVSRWHAGLVASPVLVSAGLLLGSVALVLSAVVPLTYLAYGAVSSVPDPASALALERRLTPRTPMPGQSVEVTLRVRNVSERAIPDLRLVDGVPDELAVASGSAAYAGALRAGEEATLTYTIEPRRGSYAFDPPAVRVRSLSASAVATARPTPAGDDDFECRIPLESVSIRRETTPLVGSVSTDAGGPGLEFHSTREYRRGDPPRRVDWRRYAKTGELGTVRYRKREAATVVVVVDGRPPAGRVGAPGRPDGITLASYVAVGVVDALADAGHDVGLAALGVDGPIAGVTTGSPVYVEPGSGAETGARIAAVCDAVAARAAGAGPADHSAEAPSTRGVRADGRGTVDRLAALVPGTAQFVWATPALDDEVVDLVAALRRRGYATTVVSPALTTGEDVGARLAAVSRRSRLDRLRALEVSVVDWNPETSLSRALALAVREVGRR